MSMTNNAVFFRVTLNEGFSEYAALASCKTSRSLNLRFFFFAEVVIISPAWTATQNPYGLCLGAEFPLRALFGFPPT